MEVLKRKERKECDPHLTALTSQRLDHWEALQTWRRGVMFVFKASPSSVTACGSFLLKRSHGSRVARL